MSRISAKYAQLKVAGETALIPYIMAGDPDLETTGRLVLEMERSGADMVELGVPFSDPLADGPTIQKAAIKALARGVNIKKTLKLVRQIRTESEIPIILMLYYNLVFKYGEERFVKESVSAGVDGVIIPDLPPEEAVDLMGHANMHGLDVVFLLAPTSDEERIKLVSRLSSGFIYYVSLTGVTGSAVSFGSSIGKHIKEIRRTTDMPIGVGFGISKPQHARLISKWADGVIVGSAIVRLIDGAKGVPDSIAKVSRLIRSLKSAMKN